jgi:2-aminoadipate transaminase
MNHTAINSCTTTPRFSSKAIGLELTPLQRALAAASGPNVLSLAMGLPDASLLPRAALAKAAGRVLNSDPSVLQYTLPCSYLKEQICKHMSDRGVDCTSDSIFLTHGAQQGISLLATLFLDTGSDILEETLSYPGYQHLVDAFRPNVFSVPTNANSGVDVDAVEKTLVSGSRPALMYVMPTAHNPLGVTLSHEKRCHLAHLAKKFQVPIIEDDPYGLLSYDSEPMPALRSLEETWIYYVGSFSKILGPSCRIGWIVAPKEHIQIVSVLKEGSDLNVSTLSQWIVSDFLRNEDLSAHVSTLREAYEKRRNAMNTALSREMPANVTWQVPTSGVFFWIDLPEHVDASDLLLRCINDEKVAFLPAEAFSRGKRKNGMRLNFSRYEADHIADGVARIGKGLRKVLH